MTDQPNRMDDELFDMLGAADSMPTGAPPVAAIVERGRRDRRRARSVGLVGVAAAAVVVVVGGVTLMTSGPDPAIAPADRADTSEDSGEGGSGEQAEAGPVPAAPDGTRWVGKNGVMVAVPAGWPTNALQCARTPTEDTVIVDPGVRPQCPSARPDGVTSVELRQDDTELPGGGEDLGDGVSRGRPECQESGGVCTTVVRVEELGVSVYVDSADAGLVESIAATVRRVPEGATTVPARVLQSRLGGDVGFAGYRRQLQSQGLEFEGVGNLNTPRGYSIEPAPGSVVPEGSTVRLVAPTR